MNLGFLDNTSKVTPLLVQLYDSQKLHALANDEKPLARKQLTSAVVELLEMQVSPREADLIADILIELMRQAEVDLRQAVSERVSTMDNVPLRLVLQIANDEIVVADPVLRRSPVLCDLDLIYLIKSKTPEYWRSIAQRKDLEAPVIYSLANTKDKETCMNLVENDNIEIPSRSYVTLADFAQDTPEMAQSLARRTDIPSELKSTIYRMVGSALKETLPQNAAIETEISEVVEEMASDVVETPSDATMNAAQRMKEKETLTTDMMVSALRRGQFATFTAQFATYTGQNPDVVASILKQKTGQGLAVSCKAAGIEKYDFVSMFLLTHKMRSTTRMADVSELGRAVEYFNRIDKDMAQKILNGEKPE